MTLLLTAVILLAAEVVPHRTMLDATFALAKRTVIWTVGLCKGENGEYIPVPGAKPQNYTLDFSKATVAKENRIRSLPRDRSDLAEIAMQRVLLPYAMLLRDECHVKDEVPWKSVTVSATTGVAAFEFDKVKFKPAVNYRGIINCEAHEVALGPEEVQRLNVTMRSILNLLNELTSWFDDLGIVINGEEIAGGSR